MPIAVHKPSAEPQIPTNIPKIQGVENNSPVVDVKEIPLQSLVTYVEGMSYVVNYYAQVLTKDSAVTGHDPSLLPQYQQYKRIDSLEIKVTQGLQQAQDQESKLFNIVGAGHVHSAVIPNLGDMFVADVGDGREGVFQVTNSEQKSAMQDTVYFIEYALVFFSKKDQARRDDLEIKVVQHLHYLKDLVRAGQDPLISTSEFEALLSLRNEYKNLVNKYFGWFFSEEYGTFLVPNQPWPVYDAFVVNALTSIMTTRDHHLMLKMRKFNIGDDNYLKQPQFWDIFLNGNKPDLEYCNQKMGRADVGWFEVDPFLEGIRYAGVSYIVYPSVTRMDTADQGYNRNSRAKTVQVDPLTNISSIGTDTQNLVVDNAPDSLPSPLPIKNVLSDDFYVLSQAFYTDGDNKSLLEALAENYIQNEPNDPLMVLSLIRNVSRWGGLERFYYVPILLALIKGLIRDL